MTHLGPRFDSAHLHQGFIMHDLEKSMWRASRLACSDKIIEKLRSGELLDDFEIDLTKNLFSWYGVGGKNRQYSKDQGKISYMMLNRWRRDNDKDAHSKLLYLLKLDKKLEFEEDLSLDDHEFILQGFIQFRSHLLNEFSY